MRTGHDIHQALVKNGYCLFVFIRINSCRVRVWFESCSCLIPQARIKIRVMFVFAKFVSCKFVSDTNTRHGDTDCQTSAGNVFPPADLEPCLPARRRIGGRGIGNAGGDGGGGDGVKPGTGGKGNGGNIDDGGDGTRGGNNDGGGDGMTGGINDGGDGTNGSGGRTGGGNGKPKTFSSVNLSGFDDFWAVPGGSGTPGTCGSGGTTGSGTPGTCGTGGTTGSGTPGTCGTGGTTGSGTPGTCGTGGTTGSGTPGTCGSGGTTGSGTPGTCGTGGTTGGMGKSGTGSGGKIPPPIGDMNGAEGSGSAGGKPFPTKSFWLHN
ncbi:hypothetical protein LXL04_006470 [Taraxacum kok-saghyz]